MIRPQESGREQIGPRRLRARWGILAVAMLGAALVALGSGPLAPRRERPYPSRPLEPQQEPEPVLLAPPPIDDEFFPCEDCHEGEPADPRVRELDEHGDIKLAHGDLWCLDCHQSDQRDLLHLSDASPVAMSESWRLCTRCHAKKIPDWRAGVHGKRTGNWWGPKKYAPCVACHDPHSPLFKPLEPKPPPIQANELRPADYAATQEARDEER